VLVYIEFMSRRPHVPVEGFHHIVSRGQTGWEGEHAEDRLILNVGRTWRLGPDPEYLAVWFLPHAGLERLGEWEDIFRSGAISSLEEPFRVAARIDRGGCYDPLVEPVEGKGGPYYVEYFDPIPGATLDEVGSFYQERRSRNGLVLNLLVDRIGRLGPAYRGLAVWSLPSYGHLEAVARELIDHSGPISLVDAGVYADLGDEIL